MTTLLGTIGILSLVGTITFLLLLLMQIVLKNYLHASWFYGSILFLSLFWILPLWKFVPQVSAYTFFAIDAMQSIIVPDTDTTAPAKTYTYLVWLGGLYCLVACILVMRFICQYKKQQDMLLQNSWFITDCADIECLKSLLSQYRISNTVRLKSSPLTNTPLLLGFFRYTIILPNCTLQPEQLRLVLQHELIHLKRRDNWWKIYMKLLSCIHWFNPVVYLQSSLFDNFCELSCYEKVARHLDLSQRKQYGLLILEFVQQGSVTPKNCSALQQNIDLLKKRLLHIVQYKKSRKEIGFLFIILLGMTFQVGCSLSTGLHTPEPIQQENLVNRNSVSINENKVFEQKPIESFFWQEKEGEDRIILVINSEKYEISGSQVGTFSAGPKEIQQYWEALARLPEKDLPSNLNSFLDETYR